MKYLHVNADCRDGNTFPIIMKTSNKVYEILSKLVILTRKHRELEDKLIDELAKINNMSTDEVNDIMSTYDFLVDGGDGFAILKTFPKKEKTDILVRDAVIRYVEELQVIDKVLENRIFNASLTEQPLE